MEHIRDNTGSECGNDDPIRHYTTVLRYYRLISEYFKATEVNITPELRERFSSWFAEPYSRREKDIALELVFNEVVFPVDLEAVIAYFKSDRR